MYWLFAAIEKFKLALLTTVEGGVVETGTDTPTPTRDSPRHGSCSVVGVRDTPTDGSVIPIPTSWTAI